MEKLVALPEYTSSEYYNSSERLALEYTDRITLTDEDVDDELFERLREAYSNEQIVELTAAVGLENCLSKIHHALLIESQGFCPVPVAQPETKGAAEAGRGANAAS
jgi:alkylhydroperoxidase family enzyme